MRSPDSDTTTPRKPQHQPYPYIKPTYGAKAQYAEAADVSPPLIKADKTIVQEVTGTFIYYSQSFYPNMLTAIGSIAAQQANPTEKKMQKVKQFLDYAVTHTYAIITYHVSDMILAGHRNASYLSEKKS